MTSLPPPPPPPTVPDAVSASSSSSDNNNNNNNYGPVTKLAHLAAAQEEETRREKRRQEQANLRAQASLVGETALAIAAATASGSPVRLSPQQLQAGGISPGKRVSPKQYYLQGTTPPRRSMSVAARARAAADLPSRPPPMPPAGGGDDNHSRAPMQQQQQRAPSSGNAGVSRGKFSKAQVKQMVDEWGREDTSEDDYDDDDYYDVTSDSSAGGELSNDAADDEQYKQSLQRAHHHLQYTMSHSPGPTGVEGPEEAAAMAAAAAQAAASENTDGFHYQHHRVSAYSNSKRASITGTQPGVNYPQSHEEESGGLFASAKNWLQSQRERLHQLELERQVEDQRRKLVVEGRKQRALEAERRRRNNHIDTFTATGDSSIADGTAAASGTQQEHQQQGEIPKSQSFGCIDNQVGSAETEDGELCNIPEQGAIVTGMPNLCGFGGVYAHQLTDDSTDYSGVARVDSQGNILELIPSGSLDGDEESGEHLKVCMMVSSPKFTVSGKGMSVKVDLPDDNEYREDGGEQRSNDIDNKDNSNSNNMKADKDFNRHDSTGSRHFEVVEQGVIEEDNSFFISDIKIVPEQSVDDISYSPPILHPSQMKSLIASGALPPSLTFCKWKRLYSLNRDGDSFEQFLRLVEGHDRTVLVVKTMQGNLFGGYADTRWEARHVRRHASEFYGSAQACLFRFPNFVSPRGSGNGHEDKIIIYKWSGANRYIQLCDAAKRTLAFGGGGDEGDFGLCIEDDFRRGTTGHCSTFENEALCEEGYFDVMDLEVWGFTLDF